MSIDDHVQVRRRSTIARSSGPANALPVAHVSLGRTWQHRNKADLGQLHIVVDEMQQWVLLCTGTRATRSFKGKPEQARCSDCRTTFRASCTPPSVDDMPLPAPERVRDAEHARDVPELPFIPESTRSLLQTRDSKLRRCIWCGDWQYGQSPCTTCHTPAQPLAQREVS